MPSRRFPVVGFLVVVAALLYAFYRLHEALTPFVLAAAFAYVVNPVVSYFEARGLRRIHLVVAGYLAGLALGYAAYAGVKTILVSETEFLNANAPAYARQVQRFLVTEEAKLTRALPLPPAMAERALDTAVGTVLERVQSLPSHILGLVPFLMHALLVPFIGFFFLLDGPDGFEGLIQAAPSRYVEQALHLAGEIDISLGNYLRGILIVAAAITIASFLGLVALGVDNAAAIAALAGVTSFMPYLGAIVGALAGFAMAVYQFGTFWAGAKVLILFAGIRLADEIFLEPVIARHSVALHPLVFLLALILGGETFGFLGLVFAIPAACILKALFSVAWAWYSSERGLAPYAHSCEAVPYT
jgi:predicted PurR-regulated permease PerM